jgi:hypothetical protein
MKVFPKFFIMFILLSAAVFASKDIYESISAAIRSGNATEISKYFSSSVDVTIMNQMDVYSKAQAEQVLKNFFDKNQPKSFKIIHQGISKEGAKYAIGNLLTIQGVSFRTYFYIKNNGGTENIREIRFEKE